MTWIMFRSFHYKKMRYTNALMSSRCHVSMIWLMIIVNFYLPSIALLYIYLIFKNLRPKVLKLTQQRKHFDKMSMYLSVVIVSGLGSTFLSHYKRSCDSIFCCCQICKFVANFVGQVRF